MGLKPPVNCPICGTKSFNGWGPAGSYKEPLSAGKALAGGILAGPVGAIVGASMGKRKVTFYCQKCGFRSDYDAS